MSGRVVIDQINRVLAFSTTTPLGANAVYTSPTIDGVNYKWFNGSIFSDAAGSYVLQHSDDGVSWISSASSNVTANTLAQTVNNFILRKYIRLVYTNGASPQTTFSLSMYEVPL